MDRRDILLASTVTAFGLTLPVRSLAQANSPKEKIVGVWSLVSVYDEGPDGKKYYVWGEGVQGLVIYTSGGHFSSQIMAANRDKDASKNPRMPVGQAIANFGTYSVDDEKMTNTLHIERCTFPGWEGMVRVSKIASITDEEYRSEAAVVHDPVNGEVVPKIVWKRTA